ncbi:MAG: sulfite exporter TauE/SafE family protein [Rhodospirillales bacterium]
MESISPEMVVIFGAFMAAFVAGSSGFGDALVAAAIWLHVLPPVEAAPLIISTGIVLHVFLLLRLRRQLDFRRLLPFLSLGVVGVPIGTWLLQHLPAEPFKLAVGALLILYGGGLLIVSNPPTVKRGGRGLDAAAGGIGGVLGGMAGLSGIVPAVWSGLRGWPREQARGVTQPFILIMHSLSLAAMAYAGLITPQLTQNFLYALPALVVGGLIGIGCYTRLNEERFRRIVLAILATAGVSLIV